MHAVVLPSCTSVTSAGENHTPISPLTLHPDLPSPANKAAACLFFSTLLLLLWLLTFFKIHIKSKYLMTSCCPARFTCSLPESLKSLSLLYGTIDRHFVLAWVFTLTELPSPDVSSLRTLQNTFFSPWRSKNHRKCMCVTGLEVSCSGNIKRTLGSSSSVQDTVHSCRDKWMWWGREKSQWHHCFQPAGLGIGRQA